MMLVFNDNSPDNSSLENLTKEVREKLAENGLPPSLAKLYSQHTRLGTHQPSLHNWRESETWERLHDAMRLTASALLEKDLKIAGWENSLCRAGEILEWLSHSELNPRELPLLLISSAIYQLAGYPARATGLLNQHNLNDEESRVLYYFLKADFYGLLQEIVNFWTQYDFSATPTELPWHEEEELSSAIHNWVTAETISALGVICSYMRWGDRSRLNTAIHKLSVIADIFLHGRDPYSWLLSKLCSEVAQIYYETSSRLALDSLHEITTESGEKAIDSYLKSNYTTNKSLMWYSQRKGIERLASSESFALCTPTGSGKTTVAEVAILHSLYHETSLSQNDEVDDDTPQSLTKPIALYLVPSRALAAEVESKLTHVFSQFPDEQVLVTGLYGGNDWGPTDVWFTADKRTVLICTYEKAEALIRFLGSQFLNRVNLVIIDEAHNIQYGGDVQTLVSGESRSLRLESLCARLLSHIDDTHCRVVALSAVAVGIEILISRWITGNLESKPVLTAYRSTRQLVGSLECSPTGKIDIRYDLLDNADLQFQTHQAGGQSDRPFVPNPFPPFTLSSDWADEEGSEKRTRPHLFWAALHLVQPDEDDISHPVLISVMQNIGGYADDLLSLITNEWRSIQLPTFFTSPVEQGKLELWQLCLASCEDYFTKDSREYELLERGIVLHHGKMPGLLARLLVQLIEQRIVNVVLATSTLSEGVNLPFETVLIPSIRRGKEGISTHEFRNLIGRSGRPGFGTEGRSLVILPIGKDKKAKSVRKRYEKLIGELQKEHIETVEGHSKSSLAALLENIYTIWCRISKSESLDEFLDWLETAKPIENYFQDIDKEEDDDSIDVNNSVDSLDAILLSIIVEIEQTEMQELDLTKFEALLQKVWQRTFAYFAQDDVSLLERVFVKRGLAITQTIYPEKQMRRQLYRTSLPPIAGNLLIKAYEELIPHLRTGVDYAKWESNQRYNYIDKIVHRISQIPHFALADEIGKWRRNRLKRQKKSTVKYPSLQSQIVMFPELSSDKRVWQDVLRWWLCPQTAIKKPERKNISDWHDYVSRGFNYKFNWAIGNLITLAMDEESGEETHTPSLENWSLTGLPWIIFWLKELITWGTLEPVAAYLLSKRIEVTRQSAEEKAKEYYRIYENSDLSWNDLLKAPTIQKWALSQKKQQNQTSNQLPSRIQVELLRNFNSIHMKPWRVLPVITNDICKWLDPAGFPLAKSLIPNDWEPEHLHKYDFWLDPFNKLVTSKMYLH